MIFDYCIMNIFFIIKEKKRVVSLDDKSYKFCIVLDIILVYKFNG